jgi:hypothetical protein
MQIKISMFNLADYYNDDKIVPGMHVCPCNGATSVGTIVDVGPLVKSNSFYASKKLPKFIKVVWGTGSKRGKVIMHQANSLVNFDKYLEAIKRDYDKLEDLKREAATLGM